MLCVQTPPQSAQFSENGVLEHQMDCHKEECSQEQTDTRGLTLKYTRVLTQAPIQGMKWACASLLTDALHHNSFFSFSGMSPRSCPADSA